MATTLLSLRTKLNTLLDDTGTTFYSDAERNNALNGAYYELYNKAVSLNDGQGAEVSTSTLTITSGTETIALPSDFMRLVSLFYKEDDNNFLKWVAINPGDRNIWARRFGKNSKQKAFYRRGSNIVLVPEPDYTSTTNLLMEYIPTPTEMSADGDEPTGIPETHRELLAFKALQRLKEKEGINVAPQTQQIIRLLELAFERDLDSWQDNGPRTLSGRDDYSLFEAGF